MAAQQEAVIDLTYSCTLVNHHNLKRLSVVLDSTAVSRYLSQQSPRAQRLRKRLARSRRAPRAAPSTSISLCHSCATDHKVQNKSANSTTENKTEEQKSTTPTNENQNNDTGLKRSCPICYDTFGTNPLASTACGHVFCLKCITLALKTEPQCPTCRRKLRGRAAMHPIFL